MSLTCVKYNFMEESELPNIPTIETSVELNLESETNSWDYHIVICSKHLEFIEQTQYGLRKGNFKITSTHTSKELFKIIKKEKPHLLILDVEIDEDLDGVEVCWELKSNPNTHILPVLFVSEKVAPFGDLTAMISHK